MYPPNKTIRLRAVGAWSVATAPWRTLLAGCDESAVGEFGGRRRRAPTSLHASEDGLLSFVICVVVLFFAVLLALVLNTAQAVKQKVDIQNAADACVLSSTSVTARGLNAVTMTNHLLGELTALMVLHEALGGTNLDDNVANNNARQYSSESFVLNQVFDNLRQLNEWPEFQALDRLAADALKADGGSGDSGGKHLAFGTIYDSRIKLKSIMCTCMVARVIASKCRYVQFFGIGEAVYWAINIPTAGAVFKIYTEVKILDGIEEIAKIYSRTVKRRVIENRLLPFVENYSETCVKQMPLIAEQVAEETAKRNDVSVVLHPAKLSLPVEREPAPAKGGSGGQPPPQGNAKPKGLALIGEILDVVGWATDAIDAVLDLFGESGLDLPDFPDLNLGGNKSMDTLPKLAGAQWEEIERSQWMRATYPYVRAWRKPIRDWFSGALMLSGASLHYSQWTNRYAAAKTYWYRTGDYGDRNGRPRRALSMYVMQDSPRSGKGREPWTTDGKKAEEVFTQVAIVHRDAKAPYGSVFFGSGPENGIVAYSQAIVYNGNRQGGGGGAFQPELGWDTLNWESPNSRAGAYEFPHGDDEDFRIEPPIPPFISFQIAEEPPRVRLNWQSKLTPVTRYGELWQALPFMSSDMRAVMTKFPVDLEAFRTH